MSRMSCLMAAALARKSRRQSKEMEWRDGLTETKAEKVARSTLHYTPDREEQIGMVVQPKCGADGGL